MEMKVTSNPLKKQFLAVSTLKQKTAGDLTAMTKN